MVYVKMVNGGVRRANYATFCTTLLFTCSTCYGTNIATRNKEILLRENLDVLITNNVAEKVA